MLYYFLLILLIVFSMIEIKKDGEIKSLFIIAVFVISFFLCFKYGVRVDYNGYRVNFNCYDYHSEYLFCLIENLFVFWGIGYPVFIFLIGAFSMFFIYRAIQKFSPYRSFSLLLSFHTICLTYFFSGIRQGFIIAFFLAYMIEWMIKKQWIKFIVAAIILSQIHSIAILLLILIPIYYFNIRLLQVMSIISIGIGCILYVVTPLFFSNFNPSKGVFRWYIISDVAPSYLAIAERIVLILAIALLWRYYDGKHDQIHVVLLKICLTGFIGAMILLPWNMLSIRVTIMFKAAEILLIPILIEKQQKYKWLYIVMFILYASLMTVKNVALEDGDITTLSGKYDIVFGKEDAFDSTYGEDDFYKPKHFDSFKDIFVRYWLHGKK